MRENNLIISKLFDLALKISIPKDVVDDVLIIVDLLVSLVQSFKFKRDIFEDDVSVHDNQFEE